MGSEINRLARAGGHEIALALDVDANPKGAGLGQEALAGIEVAIDFSVAGAVLTNIRRVAEAGVPMVVGTTSWYERLDEARQIIETAGTGLIYGANFSIGANLFTRLVEQAARLFDPFTDYDPYLFEHHHRGKADAPSGTALRLAERVIDSMQRKSRVQAGNPDGEIAADALHVASLRAGAAFGQHRVGFDATTDSVELVHTARGREGFARGALLAAEWIKERRGFFSFSEMLDEQGEGEG